MSHSYTCLLYHFAFGTEGRLRLIPQSLIPEIRRYTAGILRKHRGRLITAGGIPDHLHFLASLHADISVAKAAQLMKSNTSRWLSRDKGLRPFAWQEGYGAFTVSRSQVDRVRRYIDRQEEHHRKQTFDEELRELFEAHEMRYPDDWWAG